MAPRTRLAVLAFASQSLFTWAAPVDLTVYTDSACSQSESSTTKYELVSGCCYKVTDNNALIDTLSFECGSKAYTTQMTKLSYEKTGTCTGTPALQTLVSDYEKQLYKGQCTLYAATGKYHKLSAPLDDCIAQTQGQTCASDGTTFSTFKNYSDAACTKDEGTYPVSYWMAGTSPYCVVFNNNGTLSEYALTCVNGVWERSETSLFGCGGTTLPNTTEPAQTSMIDALEGQCSKVQNQDQYFKGTGTLITAQCAEFSTTIVLTTLITTTEMPWGVPWWGWFLICFALLLLCGLIGAIAAFLMRPKPKAAQREYVTETSWVVEDVMDDEAGLQGPSDRSMLAQPTATTPMLPEQGSAYGY
mmetsp:Transcript_56691/g.104963  ORF Transcript_56691/g.104963 Transcript_56691/m.104963 type:complete len:359 (+) Transcript_56691:86-1162(+)